MNRKKRFHWILIGVGAGLVILGLLFQFAIVAPAGLIYGNRKAELKEVAKLLVEKRAAVGHLDKIQSHLRNATGVEAATFEKRLMKMEEGFPTLIQFFNETATRQGVQKGRVSFKNAAKAEFGLLEVRMDLPLEGSYPEVVKFINQLERSEHLLIVDSISLQTGLENPNLVRLGLSLITYMR